MVKEKGGEEQKENVRGEKGRGTEGKCSWNHEEGWRNNVRNAKVRGGGEGREC